jgi:hypothetical protein
LSHTKDEQNKIIEVNEDPRILPVPKSITPESKQKAASFATTQRFTTYTDRQNSKKLGKTESKTN